MNRAGAARRSASAKGRCWTLPRRDLADGGAMLLHLSHPLLPEITSARPSAHGLLLGPAVPPAAPLQRSLDPGARGAYLVRLVSLTAFLKLHGLGIAPPDVAALGARLDDPSRPWLAAPPVPDWRAASPALVVAAVAARLGGASPGGDDADSLRASVQRAVERELLSDLARDVLTALRAEESGRRPEALLADLARKRDVGAVGPDLLGLVYPSAFASEEEDGTIRSAWGEAALWVVRGAVRRELDGFVECGAGSPLEEGAALLRLARMLDGDPRSPSLRGLAEGRTNVEIPEGPPVALVALETGRWDPRSRRVFETAAGDGGFVRFETRSGPVRAWEERSPLVPRLGVGEVSSLLYLPHPTLGESVAAWESAAQSAAGDAGRFLAAARRLAHGFDPAGRTGRARARAATYPPRDAVLEAASLLADGFSASEVAAAAGTEPDAAASALERAAERGLLVEHGDGHRFQDESGRRRLAAKTTLRARRDAIARLEKAGVEPGRLVAASLSRGGPADVLAGRERLLEAAASGDKVMALQLLHRAPASSPDLGAPALALRVLFDAGLLEDARTVVPGLTAPVCRDLPMAERSGIARRLVKLRETEHALVLFESPRTPAELLERARILVEARREEEAAGLLASPLLSPESLSPGERTHAALVRAEIAERRGDYESATAFLRQVRSLLPGVADPTLAYDAMLTAGYLAADMERWEEALSFFRAGRAAAADEGQRADATLNISVAALWSGRHAEAERELDTALGLYARRGDEPSYLSALGNRVDLLMRVGDFGAAWLVLERVLAHDRAPGREHQLLFAVPEVQELALLEGDVSRAHEAFREGEARLGAVGHPAWRKSLVHEAVRLLFSGRPEEALLRLEEAARLPDNRLRTEPLRKRLLLSAGVDLGRAPDPSVLAVLPAAERVLLEAEMRLARGEEPTARVMEELEGRLSTGPGAATFTGRLLEWAARFPRAFADGAGATLLALGEKAAARAGLPRAGATLEHLSRPSRRPVDPSAPRPRTDPDPEVVAEDASTRAVFAIVERIASTALPLLILGESGTGKELVAQAVHRLSGRAGRFVPVNVAAVSATLVESELFGHARGAFTGADRDRIGCIEFSSGGTLFLDEIGDLPLATQAKLLRVLQENEIRRVGETRTRRVDLRVVAATHQDLRAMTTAGTFRQDLYYRLAGRDVTLAPLRERPLDLDVLLLRALGGATLSKEARHLVTSWSWPGNVRELLSAIESARALAAPSRVLEVAHLPAAVRAAAGDHRPSASRYFDEIRKAKTSAISSALERHGGNRTRAAADLGLSRQSLLYEIKKLKIEKKG